MLFYFVVSVVMTDFVLGVFGHRSNFSVLVKKEWSGFGYYIYIYIYDL